jgi:multicomponent Na+:H+ antiporter subunit G
MNALIEIISVIFMFVGSLFYLLGSLGIVRFPDLYTRLHASTKTVVIGACGIIFGAILLKGISAASAKSLLIMIFLLLTAPTISHAIARAGYYSGVRMCPESVRDDYESYVFKERKKKLTTARRRGRMWLGPRKERELFKLVHDQITKTLSGVKMIADAARDFVRGGIETMEDEIKKIVAIERETSKMSDIALRMIPRSTLSSEDCGDLMTLIFRMTHVSRSSEALAYRMGLAEPYIFLFPQSAKSGIVKLTGKTIETVEVLGQAVEELNRDMIKAEKLSIKVSDLEDEVDVIRRDLIKTLLKESKSLDSTFFVINEIIMRLEDIADSSEEVANYIRVICVKHFHLL